MRVLVTRPAHQANAFCQQLEDLGAAAIRLPLLEIVPLDAAAAENALLRQQILNLDLYQQIIVVSANAARYAGELIDTYWPQLPTGIHWHAIGQQTAAVLAGYDIHAQANPHGFDSEALLRAPQLQDVSEQRILIMRGQGGRELLATELQQRGARTEYAELYLRRQPDYTQQQINSTIYSPLDAICITSGEALENLFTLLASQQEQTPERRGQIQATRLIVPSKRVAEIATRYGCSRVQIAEGADSQAMLRALIATIDVEE